MRPSTTLRPTRPVSAKRPAASQGDSVPLRDGIGSHGDEDPLSVRYDVLRHDFLGQGADGFVVRGVHRASGEWHALKFMSRKAYDADGEVKALQNIKHYNVVEVLDVFAAAPPERPWVVMAMPEADFSLMAYLGKSKGTARLTGHVAIDIAQQILCGLRAVHEAGYVHRDLKPGNILLKVQPAASQEKRVFGVCLCDFGRARLLPNPLRRRKRFKGAAGLAVGPMTGGVGTPQYAAPEIVLGAAPNGDFGSTTSGAGADIWSWGAMAFELFFHETFVSGDGYWQSLFSRLGRPPPPLGPGELLVRRVTDIRPLSEYAAPAWSNALQGTGAFAWRCEMRPSAATLLAHRAPLHRGDIACSGVAPESSACQVPAMLKELPPAAVADGVLESDDVCACRGHCYTKGHRYRSQAGLAPICECKALVAGSRYCAQCCCEVRGCLCPRLRGTLCSVHRRVVQQCSVALQLVRLSRRAARQMLPLDLVHFIGRYPELRSHCLFVFTVAFLRDPAVVDAWLATDFVRDFQAASLGDSAGKRFGLSIVSALRSLGDGQKDSEVREIYGATGGAAAGFLWKLWQGSSLGWGLW